MNTDTDTAHVSKTSLLGRIGLSVRGCVVIIITVTVCATSVLGHEVSKEFHALTAMVIGYYFIQKPNAEK